MHVVGLKDNMTKMGDRLVLKGSKLEFKDSLFTIEDLITEDFFKTIEPRVSGYNNNCFEVNELYVVFLQRYLAVEEFIKANHIKEIVIQNGEPQLSAFLQDIAKNNSIIINVKTSYGLSVTVRTYLTLWASNIYLLFCMLKRRKVGSFPHLETYTIIRDKASDAKLKKFDIAKFYDDLLGDKKDKSIYIYFSFWCKLKWFIKNFYVMHRSMKDLKQVVRKYTGRRTECVVMDYYAKRTASTGLYYCLIDALFRKYKPNEYFTGLNLERYAIVEEVLAKKHGVHTICIPHGLEFGFKFPYGFTTDTFYTTSGYAADYFNELYATKKFVFDKAIATKMFKRDYIIPENHEKKVIFFTESRDIQVNQEIVKQMLELLKDSNRGFCVRLHPADKKENYKDFDLHFIENFDESICDNICVARKSTVLLEATYNGSKAAAILINNKDKAIFYTFPSLQSERINIFTDVNKLVDWIKNN